MQQPAYCVWIVLKAYGSSIMLGESSGFVSLGIFGGDGNVSYYYHTSKQSLSQLPQQIVLVFLAAQLKNLPQVLILWEVKERFNSFWQSPHWYWQFIYVILNTG